VTEVLQQGKGEDWDRLVRAVLQIIQEKQQKDREGFEEVVGRWLDEERDIDGKEELWILRCYRRSLIRQMGRIEDQEIKKKREIFKEKCRWGRWYMPWASYYWKLGKKARRPELGIIVLRNRDGQICTHMIKKTKLW